MSRPMVIDWPGQDSSYYVASQDVTEGGYFALQNTLPPTANNRRLILTSGADDNSGVTLRITFLNALAGDTLTSSDVTAPASNTTSLLNFFPSSIQSIQALTGSARGLSVGFGQIGSISAIPLNYYANAGQFSLQTTVTGVITYTVEKTIDPLLIRGPDGNAFISGNPEWVAVDASLTSATTSQYFSLNQPVNGFRMRITGNTADTGSVRLTILQQGSI